MDETLIIEIIAFLLLSLIYLIIGVWLCYKRNWYLNSSASEIRIIMATLVAPLNLIWLLVRVFIVDEWKCRNDD